MKKLWSSLVVIAAFAMFASLVTAGPFPTWDNQINRPGRFVVLSDFNNQAVLDKETGLVWEQSPSTVPRAWHVAFDCYISTIGGRKGWRVPTVEELASLIDPTQANPALPAGHPFSNVQVSDGYWSATTVAGNTSDAWDVSFIGNGLVGSAGKNASLLVWCVRGGHGYDGQ
ncbi:MAG: DUF1566 domain-containing protein [Candidatus Tectomicrobia bacterium]|uniref:DUF1566 domain-containing protein n=1 Tax=Tectimicrobiota bacterium TaxID=2528274 RepID=A0A932FUN2_UNCTE|nr:DUF1566 domain-containing protein [Candidatus Tectomicrobia bacterium]